MKKYKRETEIPEHDIIEACKWTGYTYDQLRPKYRGEKMVLARYLVTEYFFYKTYENTKYRKYTLTACSNIFNQGHATSLHGLAVVEIDRTGNTLQWRKDMIRMFDSNRINSQFFSDKFDSD